MYTRRCCIRFDDSAMTVHLNRFYQYNSNQIESIWNETDSITNFYKNSNIFITGGTGFVGKALVEKLLRSCPDIQSIYLLMRPKKGRSIEERLDELLKNPVFGRIKQENIDVFLKVKAVCGDITHVNLGINKKEVTILLDKIDIVFHSAATVKFNEDLKQALIYNTLGTKQVLEFCTKIKQLKSFVYVSTAFSNSIREYIEEDVYETPYDPDAIFHFIDELSKEAFDVLSKKLLGNHPNTYTLTKALGEKIVLKYSEKIPSAIVRPSIITASWREPYPGWVDSVSGITGIFMECGRGTIKSIMCNEKYKMDIIPVDIVVNTLICAAWHTVQSRSNSMRVYNCVSGQANPITWKEFKLLTQKYSRQYPSKYVTWYPGFTYRTSKTTHIVCATLFQIIPSVILDVYLCCVGKKPIMLKISKKFYDALLAGSHFSTNEWRFEDSTMRSLIKAVNAAPDGKYFETDIDDSNGFSWEEYVKNFNLGVRQYILKDDLSSLEQAKIKLNRLFWFQKIIQIVPIYILCRIAVPYLNQWIWEML
ncbi:unnamed protein product [Psylliodes chrysocephalus]|uniref:Fatty acyl-CoA reductase n=1 Tax=Psylliodes chrysocephalus TaxID=3402493 RepID=A0A9P0GEA1_9CUCU|nr:unnamed protein product [Psylliodes chrysocephala]